MRLALVALAGLALTALPASAVTVETQFSTEFQKKLDKDYGKREADVLSKTVVRRIERNFMGTQAARVVVTIEDAKPNRPTFGQLSNTVGLDPMRSISIGGANLKGVAYDASGKEIGSYDYKWYESDISQVIGYATWHDADWTIARFAKRFADKVD